jgi:single-stranded DNA-specific DHH superfamily exonuclease
MALTEKQYNKLRKELEESKRPLFFFHDDPDGLCSFLLLYRYIKEGKGIVVKSSPKIDSKFIQKVKEYEPDKIFILDIAIVTQDFIDAVSPPIIWIDHHEPLDRDNIQYFNPRIKDHEDNVPVSELCYYIVKQDMWLAEIGAVSDWHLPSFNKEFTEKYPKLLSTKIKKPDKAIYESELGKLISIFSMILKGKTSDVIKCVKVLTRIQEPDEILKHDTPPSRFIHKRYKKVYSEYKKVLNQVLKQEVDDKLIIFIYSADRMSFTKELSNEILYRFPKKVILIAREKSGEMKCSLRSPPNVLLPPILQKALFTVQGYGGGHEHACGAVIKKEDFPQFIENLKKQL